MDQAAQLRIYFQDGILLRLKEKQEEVRNAIIYGDKSIQYKLFRELDVCQKEFERSYSLKTHCRKIDIVDKSIQGVMI